MLPTGKHKVVFLDEIDSMTARAQQVLVQIMENFHHTTRFALACNYSKKIIDSIQSRCAILKYSRLSDREILDRIKGICISEKIPYLTGGLEAIVFTASGDMRQALNNLQATVSGFNLINHNNVFRICDQPYLLVIMKVIKACLESDIVTASSAMNRICNSGYGTFDIITTLFKVTRDYEPMHDFIKLDFLKEIGLTHVNLGTGKSGSILLIGLLAKLCKLTMRNKIPYL